MTAPRPSRLHALAVAVGTSVLFLVVYNTTNWITSQRAEVGTWYYGIERHIPFVPAMILPYMSIDLFFVLAPFVCTTRLELRVFTRRVALAVLVAGSCFLLFPLTLAVERPPAAGMFGPLFNSFREIDLPYNLCPSLHIALRTILAAVYHRHTRGVWRWASNIWFFLIGLSTLLTYQHHIVDVVGGFILGIACLYLVRETPLVQRRQWRWSRIGGMYAVVSLLLGVTGVRLGSWSLWMLWPAIATGLVALGYFRLGPEVYRKADGRLPFAARLVLGPVIDGQVLSWYYYRRQCRPWDEVTDNVWIGRRLTDTEAQRAVDAGVTAVVDLTVAFSEAAPFRAVHDLPLPVLDLTAPTPAQLAKAVAFIEKQSQSGIVYVHCKIGYSRSAAIVGAWLMASGVVDSTEAAIAALREVRPSIVIRPEARAAIQQYETSPGVATPGLERS